MKRLLPLLLFIGGFIFFAIAFMFYQKSERLKSETEALRSLNASINSTEDQPAYEPPPEPVYDPADLDQTPPGVTPFIGTTVCLGHWGNHLRQYCAGGDDAPLELIEGGDDQAETMRILTMCLNELLQRKDAYDDIDMRPMDSPIPLNEESRKALSCEMVGKYGDNPIFNNASVYYMIKEDMESGNITRLENR